MPKTIKVKVLPGRVVHTHPKHVDGLRAPRAEVLAETGGIDGPAEPHREGETVELPADVAEPLIEQGVVERA